ncbi:hypothetical protein [Actinomadura rupiterrae]|uniref:hypothetical protein n=1 Tax=Actinomadura rupiterrae TaxID=559627 RepID=UPI0020A29AE1|nr:hypothetical protein [Actinomadura rupiterrae]MCP2337730.1 hypothetical protein [Actinomadura rupiterrae]
MPGEPSAFPTPTPAITPAITPAPSPGVLGIGPPVRVRDETPPPVAEVLAVYAGRSKDPSINARGMARVRDSLERGRAAAAQRRLAQRAARRSPRSA